jgi:hypothetical protein
MPELGTPWALCGFVAARTWAPRRAAAALAGAGVIGAGLGSYFVFVHLWHGVPFGNLLNDGRGRYWFTLALGVGLVVAVAGWSSRSPSRPLRAAGWGFAPAVPLTEVQLVTSRGGPSPALAVLVLLLCSVGFAVWTRKHHRPQVDVLLAAAGWTAMGLVSVPFVLHVL